MAKMMNTSDDEGRLWLTVISLQSVGSVQTMAAALVVVVVVVVIKTGLPEEIRSGQGSGRIKLPVSGGRVSLESHPPPSLSPSLSSICPGCD